MDVRNLLLMLRHTDWNHFFDKNGPGEIEWRRASGWQEQPNDLSCAFFVHGRISGGARGMSTYAAWQADDTGDPVVRGIAEEEANKYFESFAHPDCRCRVGFHWKCGIHKSWKG